MKNITILPHHLDVIISKYYFSDGWEESLDLIKEQHGQKMVNHAKKVVSNFFNSVEVKVVIERPDSICGPNLSTVCNRCMVSYGIDAYPSIMDLDKDEAGFKEYQLGRMRKDESYRKVRNIRLNLNEVTILFYYGLEPKKYSPKFLINKIEKTARKLGRDSPSVRRPSEVGYSSHESIKKEFPDVYKLMENGLYEDFIERTLDEDPRLKNEKMANKELDELKKKYSNLFSTVGSDSFYYEVLKIIKK